MFNSIICDVRRVSMEERPLFLLDSGLNCIFSGNREIIRKGMNITSMLRTRPRLPLESSCELSLYHRGHFYYARLIPVRNMEKERAYVCEVVDMQRAAQIYDMTDLGSQAFLEYSNMQHLIAQLWRSLSLLREADDTKTADTLEYMEELLYGFSDLIANKHEHLRSVYGEKLHTLFNIDSLCERLCDRCNAVLAKCGRRIDYVGSDAAQLYVNISARSAVTALVNVVQNALLYSPADTVPVLMVYSESGYIVVRMVNESIMYSKEDFADGAKIEFGDSRSGGGMSIIRAFAESAGGTVSCEHKDGIFAVSLRLPAAASGEASEYCFESETAMADSSCIPDYLQIKMHRVAKLFDRSEKTGNIQGTVTYSS